MYECIEEKKIIAREYRLKAKKEKKKGKSDAKKQRKENAILLRRTVSLTSNDYLKQIHMLTSLQQTRNNEKYSKNKDRNKQRAVDIERNKIRHAAVRQAEILAGQHDLSGKLFNVGEVIIMPDGQAKSVESLRRTAEVKAKRKDEREEQEKSKLDTEEMKKASIPQPNQAESLRPGLDGVNPQRIGLIHTNEDSPRISNKQRKAQETLNPRHVPLKPVIPEGYEVPINEENFIAMWDLTNDEIMKRIDMAKKKAGNARKALRREQKEEKKINKAMKVLRKEAASKGVLFDPEQAKRMISGEEEPTKPLEGMSSDSNSDSDSDSGSDSTSSSGSDMEVESKSDKIKTSKKASKVPEAKNNSNTDKPKKRKRSIEDVEEESGADTKALESVKKKAKKEHQKVARELKHVENLAAKLAKSQAVVEEATNERKAIEAEDPIAPSDAVEKKREKKQKKHKGRTDEGTEVTGSEKKKEKETKNSKVTKPVSVDIAEVVATDKKHKKGSSDASKPMSSERSVIGENWNTDALTGDEARKQKFLRLLGAGKASGDASKQQKSSKKNTDIFKVQSDLEKQYEAGMKLKHDGGSKRRGLGA